MVRPILLVKIGLGGLVFAARWGQNGAGEQAEEAPVEEPSVEEPTVDEPPRRAHRRRVLRRGALGVSAAPPRVRAERSVRPVVGRAPSRAPAGRDARAVRRAQGRALRTFGTVHRAHVVRGGRGGRRHRPDRGDPRGELEGGDCRDHDRRQRRLAVGTRHAPRRARRRPLDVGLPGSASTRRTPPARARRPRRASGTRSSDSRRGVSRRRWA